MSLVLYSLGVLINEIVSTSSDLSVNILASIIYDQAKKYSIQLLYVKEEMLM